MPVDDEVRLKELEMKKKRSRLRVRARWAESDLLERPHAASCRDRMEIRVSIIVSPSAKMGKIINGTILTSCLLPPTRHRWCLWRHSATEILSLAIRLSESLPELLGDQSNRAERRRRQNRETASEHGGSSSRSHAGQRRNSGLRQTPMQKTMAPKSENICATGKQLSRWNDGGVMAETGDAFKLLRSGGFKLHRGKVTKNVGEENSRSLNDRGKRRHQSSPSVNFDGARLNAKRSQSPPPTPSECLIGF